MKILSKTKEKEKILLAIKKLLEKENISGEAVILEDEELKGALSIKVRATNIKSIDKAIKKTKELNEKINKLFPDKYITITVIPA
ncbi:MAG: hypothetical protein GXO22_06720 [Aquificae bacterium]|nr:hypothetical protein [Aquificota bacterium]